MGRCRGAASMCMQCLVAHVPPFSWVFQGLPAKSLTVFPGGTNSLWTIPWLSKKQMSIDLILDLLILAFLGWGEFAVCHSRLWHFVSGLYSKIHYSSPVIKRLKNSGSLSRRSRRSRHTSLQLTFCSVMRFFGTILAHTFLMSKSCVKIWWTVNRFKFNSLLIILKVNRQSDLTRDLTLSTLSSVFEVEGLRAWGSSSTCSRPSKKGLVPSEHLCPG